MKRAQGSGVWKPEHEAHNQQLVKRQETLAGAWGTFTKANPPDDKDAFAKAWMAARKTALTGGRHGSGIRVMRRSASGAHCESSRPQPMAISATPAQEAPCRPPHVRDGPAVSAPQARSGSCSPIRTPPLSGPVEGEVTRVRKLAGAWRWLLVTATAATILLCINQQFTLRFFIGYTQLNTEYYYLLILCMLPFTFLIFPGTETAPLDRVPWYDAAALRSPRSAAPST